MNVVDKKNVTAWVLMVSAVVLHVIDEAAHDFLPFYNRLVLNLRSQLGFFPAPTFTFGIWIGGLAAAAIIGFALAPLVGRGGRVIRIATTALGILMIVNALGHIVGSIYFGRLIPGFWSSPVLLFAAIYVVYRGFRGKWAN